MTEISRRQVVIVLDNIRSIHNVGSIFRTSDALGASKICLCGLTPQPLDKYGRKRKDLAKVALGAEEAIAYEYFATTKKAILALKKEGFYIVSIEQSQTAVDYKKVKIKSGLKVAIVLGSEVAGIDKKILELSDLVAEIPMKGGKESLNVVVAFGVAAFRILGF